MRTIALLLALADLAEQAAGVSHAIRSYMLWVMRPAEAVAWDYAFGTDDDELTDFDLVAICNLGGNTPRDALDLAASFREIAAALQQVMIQYRLIASIFGSDGWENGSAFSRMTGHPYSVAARRLSAPAQIDLSAYRVSPPVAVGPSRRRLSARSLSHLAAVVLAALHRSAAARSLRRPRLDTS